MNENCFSSPDSKPIESMFFTTPSILYRLIKTLISSKKELNNKKEEKQNLKELHKIHDP